MITDSYDNLQEIPLRDNNYEAKNLSEAIGNV